MFHSYPKYPVPSSSEAPTWFAAMKMAANKAARMMRLCAMASGPHKTGAIGEMKYRVMDMNIGVIIGLLLWSLYL